MAVHFNPYTSNQPIPSELPKLLPEPSSPWKMSSALFQRAHAAPRDATMRYRSCDVLPSDPEFAFVTKYFMADPPPGLCISKIMVLHNPTHTEAFEHSLRDMDTEISKFPPTWQNEDHKQQRAEAHERWEVMKNQFQPLQVQGQRSLDTLSQDLAVLPLFHGSSPTKCDSIASSGFVYFGKHGGSSSSSTDIGYFGSGLYFTNSAQYGAMYASGTMLLAMVAMRPPYPVISDTTSLTQQPSDMQKLSGMGAYKDYNSHFIPVTSMAPGIPGCMIYYPAIGAPAWDEFVVFHKSQALPQFRIELGPQLLQNPSLAYSFDLCVNACQTGKEDLVKQWLDEDSSRITEKSAEGKTLLHFAAESGQQALLSLLLRDNALLNLTDSKGRNAFHYAAENGHIEIAKILLSKKPAFVNIPTNKEYFPIHLAALTGQVSFLRWLHSIDAKLVQQLAPSSGWSILHFAAFGGYSNCVEWAYDQIKKSPTSLDGSSALHVAAELGRTGAAEALIKKDTALLKKWRDKKNAAGFTPTQTAAHYNQAGVLQLLLESKTSVTTSDNDGYLPIHWVCKRGSMQALQTLLAHQTPLDPKGLFGRTPLHMAAFSGHALIAQVLILRGANINAQTDPEDNCKTPLHDAVIHDDLAMVQVLTSSPALNVNLQDSMGSTSLAHAARDGLVEIIQCILHHSSYTPEPAGSPNSIQSLCTGKIFRNQDAVIKALQDNS